MSKETRDFCLANVDSLSLFNFYPTMAAAEADMARANDRPHSDTQYTPMTWEAFAAAKKGYYLNPTAEQITEEKWAYALGVLPPMKWEGGVGWNSFLMSEMSDGVYTKQYVCRVQGDVLTYWSKMVDATDRTTWMTFDSLAMLHCITCGRGLTVLESLELTSNRPRVACAACKTGHHCDKRCGREAAIGSDLCDVCGRVPLVWEPAEVGCYWNSGPFHIATYRMAGDDGTSYAFPASGYRLTREFIELGNYPTLEEAQAAAEVAG